MGMLNSLQHFFLPALAPATFNIVAIVFAIALSPLMPALGLPPILSVAIAVTVGGLTQVAIQWPALVREGFRYRFRVDVTDPGLRHVLVLMGPGTVGLAATQLNLFVSTLLAAREGTGAVSWLQYAFRVMYLPLGLFGVSIATAVLPSASRHVAVRDLSAAREIVRRGLSLMLVVSIPAACGLLVLSTDIVRLLFERGRFTPQDTLATAAALRLYAVGLVGFAATRILSPVFYALGHNRVPVALSIVSVTVNLVMSLLLVRAMGFTGLALATSLAAIVNATSCIVLLRRRLDGIGGRALGVSTLKVAAASAVMLVSVSAVRAGMSGLVSEGGVLVQALALTATIGIGLAALALASRVLGIEEITALARKVRGGGGALLDR
jgi:putative peptidoglycan lipid II flippase